MFQAIWAALMASKGAKIGGGVVAGGGTLIVALNLLGARIDAVEKHVDDVKKEVKTYVDFKHDAVLLQLKFMNDRQLDMNDMLKTLGERMYNERKHSK